MSGSPLNLLATLCSLLLPACGPAAAPEPAEHVVCRCTWSYFGDPRAIAVGRTLITGCVTRRGDPLVEARDLGSGRRRVSRPFDRLEADDHNNPSLVAFRGRVFAFSTPHSGYAYPRDRSSMVMRYRSTGAPLAAGGGWGPSRTVPLGKDCGLGYTYPNPVVAGDRLYLFMRGPCWSPYVTWTDDGVHWARGRTLLRAPDPPGPRAVRPYAKYAPAADGSILMLLSDGHPDSWRSGLYFARFRDGRFFTAGGALVGDLADGPPAVRALERVHAPRDGRAWPMDVAEDAAGDPVAVYSSLDRARDDTFHYARFDAGRWETHAVADAGEDVFGYHNQGATLDHADPRRVVLSRTVGDQHEIEQRVTADGGRTWEAHALTRDSAEFNVRPVIPRGLAPEDRGTVLYVAGRARHYRDYDTRLVLLRGVRAG
ncbi:MAG TPA: BNR-4 repeat-containing protein [Solirubrobacteraceae bacterium]|nr:BNR-4 repeat-containing protein [Solirubrobacteraceae bacterium]